MVNPPYYYCPECRRNRTITDPCEHVSIEGDAMPLLRELQRPAPVASVSPLVVGYLPPPEMFALGVRVTRDALAGNPIAAADALHLLDSLARHSWELDAARQTPTADAELSRWRVELDGWQAIAIDELETDSASFKDDPPRSPAILIEACRRLAVLFIRLHTKG